MYFRGRLSGSEYAKALVLRVAALVGLTLIFPFVVMLLADTVMGCRKVQGACGALGLLIFLFGKPIIFAAFVLSLVGTVVRRVRDIGLPGGVGLVLPGLLAINWQVGVVFGTFWAHAFVLGHVGGLRFLPFTFLAAIAGLIALCFVPSGWAEPPDRQDDPETGPALPPTPGPRSVTTRVAGIHPGTFGRRPAR